MSKKKVAIVGAGASGLSAARFVIFLFYLNYYSIIIHY